MKLTLDRRQFFQLATATGAIVILPEHATAATFTAPAGVILPFADGDPPAGWMVADGRALPTADYPDLFKQVGYNYGRQGNDFRLPDFTAHAIPGWNGEPLAIKQVQRIISVEDIEAELSA